MDVFNSSIKPISVIDDVITDAYARIVEENYFLKNQVAALSERPMESQRAEELLAPDKIVEMGLNHFQQNASHWVKDTFGEQSMASERERAMRFLEEAIELAQACGLDKANVMDMMAYVYGRPSGPAQEEIGGVLMTLFPLAGHFNLSAGVIANDTLKSCWQRQDKIREKHWRKPTHLLGVTKES